jgi:hypothetical protein
MLKTTMTVATPTSPSGTPRATGRWSFFLGPFLCSIPGSVEVVVPGLPLCELELVVLGLTSVVVELGIDCVPPVLEELNSVLDLTERLAVLEEL